jgi:hypothetical protein
MILTIHNLAKTYMLLPSEVLGRATTFDLYVLDTHSRFIKYQEQKAKGKAPPVSSKKHSKDELQAMINDARAYAEKERKKK